MRVLVTGDRNWTNKKVISDALVEIGATVVIEGEARGADRLARQAAEAVSIPVLKFPAHWSHDELGCPAGCKKVEGRAAGVIRNQEMLDWGGPDIVFAFHDHLDQSRGTADMIQRAQKAGVPVKLYSQGEWTTL